MKKTLLKILTLLMVFQTISFVMPVKAASSVTTSDNKTINGLEITHTQTLTDNFDGTFTLTIDLESSFSIKDGSEDSQIARKSYFTAQQEGEYLIELWGGNGGKGQDSSYNSGGQGGQGGYIYGIVHLDEGETIYYNLGGHGGETVVVDEGGGINGNGGGHGDTGSYTVGGGGGYSAVFKFEKGEFEDKYLDSNGEMVTNDIDESDRITKYIMIAAGGGGGGAGNGWVFGITPTGTPDGGAGGSISSVSGILEGEGYKVEGTYFVGEDGKSSGTSTAFVGKGGSNVPGEISETFITLFEGKQPNDWEGAANPDYTGGSGGSGNLHGGAGGAGYAGGSGGIMASLITPFNIGGGGGGSSFIANDVNYNLTDEQKELLSTIHDSKTGGAINITYLDNGTSFFGTMTLSGQTSEYFTITNATTTIGEISTTGNSFTLTKMNVQPDTQAETVVLTLKPIDGFAGGNNVPIFTDDKLSLKGTYTQDGNSQAIDESLQLGTDCSYVNVPLDFEVITHNHSYDETQNNFDTNTLYTDKYVDIRNNLTENPQYAFIESISNITTYDSTNNIVSGQIVVNETTRFPVSFTVTPKNNGVATVGNEVKTTEYRKDAIVTILKDSEITLNDLTLSYTKQLTYDDNNDKYILSLNVIGEASETVNIPSIQKYIYTSENEYPLEYPIPEDGYYLIQAWGGNGGNGLVNGGDGGVGGIGGYTNGFMYFDKGNMIIFDVGSNGSNAISNNTNGVSTGGQASIIKYKISANNTEEAYLLISGGGGGGGNGGNGWWSDDDGDSGYSPTILTVSAEPKAPIDETYDGDSGSTGSAGGIVGSSGIGGSGGAAGENYINENLSQESTEFDLGDVGDYNRTNEDGGAVYITCLQVDTEPAKNSLSTKLSNYELSFDITKYFDIGDITYSGTNSDDNPVAETINDSIIAISNVDPTLTSGTQNGDGTVTVTSSFDFTVNIELTPKSGFLGGNDVLVLEECISLSQGDGCVEIPEQDSSDYANVEIPYTANPTNLTTYDKTYIFETPGVNKDDLFDFSDDTLTKTYDWEDDYVEIFQPGYDLEDELKPQITTQYPIKMGIEPKANSIKAVVVDSVEGSTITKNATIYVENQVVYDLDFMTTSDTPNEDGYYSTPFGEDYTAILTPNSGYVMPNSIQVKIGNTIINNYTFDSKTGEVTIPSEEITGVIIITASAKVQTFTITYTYQSEPNSLQYTTVTKDYVAGSTINESDISNITIENKEHYNFVWDWATKDGNPLTIMPAQDWWVTGTYIPKVYTLTVNYYEVDTTNKVFESVVKEISYGDSYNIISPEKAGYLADKINVTGTIDSEDPVINVYYTPTQNQLNIIYIYEDTNEIIYTYQKDVPTNETYSVDSTALLETIQEVDHERLKGYSTENKVISGTMTENGATYYVYYRPNTYKVTFDANQGNCNVEEKEVIFNNIYGYDGALPKPDRLGYDFDGWYLGETKITEETRVTTAENHTLVAQWKAREYVVTVKFQYEDGTEAFTTITETKEVGDKYYYTIENIFGYEPDIKEVSGTVIPQNTTILVTYIADRSTIHFDSDEGSTIEDQTVIYNSPYGYDGKVLNDLPTPTKTGHEFVGWYYNDELITKDTFVDTTENHTLTAKWETAKYTLTIHYQYEDGSQALDDFIQEYNYNTNYTVSSKTIEGHTPNMETVSGTISEDTEITVIYTINSYKLTIKYLNQDGSPLLDEENKQMVVERLIKYNSSYSVHSPVVEDFTCSQEIVEGIMGAEDKVINVYYYKNTPIIYVTVSWGNLSFNYDHGTWNPLTHTYDGRGVEVAETGTNKVTVKNNEESNVSVDVEYSYIKGVDYQDMNAYFTSDNTEDGTRKTNINIPINSEDTAYVWLEGTLPRDVDETIISGVCNVTINGGASSSGE